jgi:2-C-methyl-D-erythritol 4-phosphate cytidylyltransferase
MEQNVVLILAGGTGIRFGKDEPKQFARLANKSVIEHTLDRFEYHRDIHVIYIVSHPDYIDKTKKMIRQQQYNKVEKVLPGGKTRQESSWIGLEAIDKNVENVLIHDAVRPLVDKVIIDKILKKMDSYSAVTVAVPSSDTVIEIGNDSIIQNIPKRHLLRLVQTPQAFKLDLICQAHRMAKEKKIKNVSDDCSLVVQFGLADIFVIDGNVENIKITHPNDIQVAEEILRLKQSEDC